MSQSTASTHTLARSLARSQVINRFKEAFSCIFFSSFHQMLFSHVNSKFRCIWKLPLKTHLIRRNFRFVTLTAFYLQNILLVISLLVFFLFGWMSELNLRSIHFGKIKFALAVAILPFLLRFNSLNETSKEIESIRSVLTSFKSNRNKIKMVANMQLWKSDFQIKC